MKLRELPFKAWDRAKTGYSFSIGAITASIRFRRTRPKSGPSRISAPGFPAGAPEAETAGSESIPHQGQTCLIVGAGPNLGSSLARCFGAAGFNVAVARRQTDLLAPLISELMEKRISACGFQCDATDGSSVQRLFKDTAAMFGAPDCVIFNLEEYAPGTIDDITPSAFEDCWRSNCFAGFLVGKRAAEMMRDRDRGTIIFSGATASRRGKQGYINLAVGKAGLRALAQSMAKELGPAGIHVCHVVLDGGTAAMGPDDVAANYLHLHHQPANAWTHELDLRTSVEPW